MPPISLRFQRASFIDAAFSACIADFIRRRPIQSNFHRYYDARVISAFLAFRAEKEMPCRNYFFRHYRSCGHEISSLIIAFRVSASKRKQEMRHTSQRYHRERSDGLGRRPIRLHSLLMRAEEFLLHVIAQRLLFLIMPLYHTSFSTLSCTPMIDRC